ncbi:MAG TPA: endopeptidase La, partial [Blastocatellia bacterium]|nr:endopeptidase La [Blastocatellia bacterium]
MPRPLLDRMEIIRISGYTEDEKLEIVKRHLLKKQMTAAGLKSTEFSISDNAILDLIRYYTREAGVRQLERAIGNLARKIALRVAEGKTEKTVIGAAEVKQFLGPPRFHPEEARTEMPPGVATGMAWTEMGGEVLFIEATELPGGSGLTLTGQLGDVMKESAQAARSYLWSHAGEFGIDPEKIKQNGVHLHVPAGAIPKDGPSAGVTMASALASLYTGRKVRVDTAMTGEITLSGLVFPVGGVKEKVLAAHRAGIRRIILPSQNEHDIDEIPDDVRRDLEVIPADRVCDVIRAALETGPPKKPETDGFTVPCADPKS